MHVLTPYVRTYVCCIYIGSNEIFKNSNYSHLITLKMLFKIVFKRTPNKVLIIQLLFLLHWTEMFLKINIIGTQNRVFPWSIAGTLVGLAFSPNLNSRFSVSYQNFWLLIWIIEQFGTDVAIETNFPSQTFVYIVCSSNLCFQCLITKTY